MRAITWFGDWTRGTFLIIALVSRMKDNSVPQTDNFVNVNVFNSVTCSHVLSYWKLKLCRKRKTQ